jgi:hypothetical protein
MMRLVHVGGQTSPGRTCPSASKRREDPAYPVEMTGDTPWHTACVLHLVTKGRDVQIPTIFSNSLSIPSTKNTSSKTVPSADDQASNQPAQETSAGNDIEQEFLKYAHMNPIDRMRANILKGMGLTEDDLKNMPPQQRQAVEQKIKDLIDQEAHKNADKKGQLIDVSA